MLFSYHYVPHQPMGKMHGFINYIFYKVWCRAKQVEYSIELFKGNKDLLKIMQALSRLELAEELTKDKNKAAFFFYQHINDIFNEFKKLTNDEIEQYKVYYQHNNNIEKLCQGLNNYIPITYDHLNPQKESLNKKLNNFFQNLYSIVLPLSNIKSVTGTLKDYYKCIVKENRKFNSLNTCPFCGLTTLDTEFSESREAFDHYLPKSKYPFNSVNLKNLAPICNKCNARSNKGEKNPLYNNSGSRRKAFYPYADKHPTTKINIMLAEQCNLLELKPDDVNIIFCSKNQQDEIETWKDLFNIESRYKEWTCTHAVSWLETIFIHCTNYQKQPADVLKAELDTAKRAPWKDTNFLKKSFLEACDRKGLVNAELLDAIIPGKNNGFKVWSSKHKANLSPNNRV